MWDMGFIAFDLEKFEEIGFFYQIYNKKNSIKSVSKLLYELCVFLMVTRGCFCLPLTLSVPNTEISAFSEEVLYRQIRRSP